MGPLVVQLPEQEFFTVFILGRRLWHLADEPLWATASGIACCTAVHLEVAEFSRRFCAISRRTRRSRPSSSARTRSRRLASSQHAGRRPTIFSAFSRVSAGDAVDAIACLFYSADVPHAIVNSQLRKDGQSPHPFLRLGWQRLLGSAGCLGRRQSITRGLP